MIENNSASETPGSEDQLSERRKKAPATDKTEVELDAVAPADAASPGAQPGDVQESAAKAPAQEPGNDLADRRKKSPKVNPTNLDTDALRVMAAKTVSQKEEKIREELESRPVEPAKPLEPIDKYRPASPCSAAWDKMKGTGNSRFCEQCKSQVYDFTKVDLSEAEEIIFKKEGKRNFVLFKRTDGKFLTVDCPVGVKRKQTLIAVSAVAVLAVAGGIYVLVTMPPPPPPNPAAASGDIGKQQQRETPSVGSIGARSGSGWETVTTSDNKSSASSTAKMDDSQHSSVGAALPPQFANQGIAPTNDGSTSAQIIGGAQPGVINQPTGASMSGQQMPGINPANPVNPVNPTNPPAPAQSAQPAVVPLQPAQPPTAQSGSSSPASVPPSGVEASPATGSESSASPAQSTRQPGVWQRP